MHFLESDENILVYFGLIPNRRNLLITCNNVNINITDVMRHFNDINDNSYYYHYYLIIIKVIIIIITR